MNFAFCFDITVDLTRSKEFTAAATQCIFSSEHCLKQSDPCSWKSSFSSSTFSLTTFSVAIFTSSIPSSSSTFLESIFFSASLSKYFLTIFKSFSLKTCLNSLIKSQKSSFSKSSSFPSSPPFLLHLFHLLLHLHCICHCLVLCSHPPLPTSS